MKSLEKRSTTTTGRRGQVLILTAGSMVLVMGMVAFTVDIGYIAVTKTKLQATADAIVLASLRELPKLPDDQSLFLIARQYAGLNYPEDTSILADSDIEIGNWDGEKFTPTNDPSTANALRVTVRRSQANGNPLSLFFAPVLGNDTADVSATAVVFLSKVGKADILPIALRGPGFGPVDPEISKVNPGKDGPSMPKSGDDFKIGDEVTVFIFGKGKKSPVHLTLIVDSPGPGASEADVKKVLKGSEPPVPVSVGDEYLVFNEGTGSGSFGEALDDRLLTPVNSPVRDVVIAVAEELPNSRN